MPNLNGVVLAQPAQGDVRDRRRAGVESGWVQGRVVAAHLGAHVGDFNGDGRADVLLQGQTASEYELPTVRQGERGRSSSRPRSLDAGDARPRRAISSSPAPTAGKGRATVCPGACSPTGSNSPCGARATLEARSRRSQMRRSRVRLRQAAQAGLSPPQRRSRAARARSRSSRPTRPGARRGSSRSPPWARRPIRSRSGRRPARAASNRKLALVYTSGSPDGVDGPGWNLAGLSAIARCNKTYADNNGAPAPVTLTTVTVAMTSASMATGCA